MFATQAPAFRKSPVKIIGERSSAVDMTRGRLFLLGGFFVIAYLLLAARAFDLTVLERPLDKIADSFPVHDLPAEPLTASRADIYDRNGILLATTLKTASLYADPYLISNIPATAQGLSKIFPDMSMNEILHKLQNDDKKRFIWLKKNLTPHEQYEVTSLGEPGLAFKFEDRRIYPQGKLTSHVVGFTDVDNRGLSGMERGFNTPLKAGKPITLSIDLRLQHIMHREVQKAIQDFNAKAGVGMIMDVNTGELLAGVSLPDFEPHGAGDADDQQVFNRMTLGTYELGSVIKIFSTAAFLETHAVPMSTTFDASEPLREGRFVINDYHAENRILTIPEIFMYSSNIGAAMMGQAVGTDRLKGFFAKAGLTETMVSDFPEVARPQVPAPWRDLNTLTASYGHGFATTPLQFLAGVSSIVNGGYKVDPRIIEDGKPDDLSQHVRLVSEDTSTKMRELLRLVVTEGTGSKANVAGYHIGGKTGTAEKPGLHGYDSKRLISSFVGVFPIEKPRYAVFVLVDEPQGNKESYGYATAGWVAAPAVGRVVTSMASILGIPPQTIPENQDMDYPLKQFVTAKSHE